HPAAVRRQRLAEEVDRDLHLRRAVAGVVQRIVVVVAVPRIVVAVAGIVVAVARIDPVVDGLGAVWADVLRVGPEGLGGGLADERGARESEGGEGDGGASHGTSGPSSTPHAAHTPGGKTPAPPERPGPRRKRRARGPRCTPAGARPRDHRHVT